MQRQWFVASPGGVRGPMDGEAVVRLVRSGEIQPGTQVCCAVERDWAPMQRFLELVDEMARQDAAALAAPPEPWVGVPPPPPGEPWFYDVPTGRAILLQVASFGWYFPVWQHRHQSWLRRRGPVHGSQYDDVDRMLPWQLGVAKASLGLRPGSEQHLPPHSAGLYVLVYFICLLLPILVAVELQFIVGAQRAAEEVNRAVAPMAARPPMELGEWLSLAGGLVSWGIAALLLVGLILQVLHPS